MADKHRARKNWRCTLERAEKFISPQYFADVNLFSRLYPKKLPVSSLTHYAARGRVPYSEAVCGKFVEAQVGNSYGPTWSTHWFKVVMDIPQEWTGEEVHFRWNSGSEAMVWQEGKPKQGLTGGDGHQQRTDYVLSTKATPGSCTLYVEMAANGMFGAGKDGLINAPDPKRHYTLSMAEIAVFKAEVYEVLMDLTVLIDLAKNLPQESPRAFQALYTANDIVNACQDLSNKASLQRAHEIAARFLTQTNGESQHQVHAVGNCHIDCAWLWPVAETVRKCGRSFATAVRLMEKYPDFKFVCSQAQQLEWVKIHYPTLFDEIKVFVSKGQFIPVGGTWVEMFWLPDTFGYSAQLPQIIRGVGMKYFLTMKLSWSLINKFPFHTFFWEGIDGSRCLAHFPPADTYESRANAADVIKTVRQLKDKGKAHASMLLYGHGDGGGGPSEDMLEMLKRMEDVDGCPKVKLSDPHEFFHSLESRDGDKLCTWVGELYLELHQGTYTTQAQIKRENRQSEFLLHDSELMSTLSFILGGNNADLYPTEEYLRIWKLMLLNQFHDILPGSCIKEAADDALTSYKEILKSTARIFNDSCSKVISQLNSGKDKCVTKPVLVNTLSWPRSEVVTIPKELWERLSAKEQSSLKTQISQEGENLLLVSVSSTSISNAVETTTVFHPVSVSFDKTQGSFTLENALIRVELVRGGLVRSLVHKASGREAISPGYSGNQFILFDDVPLFWDAWDVMPYYLETRKLLLPTSSEEFKIMEEGPLRVSVEFSIRISERSSLRQTVSLDADLPYVKFHTKVEWHENRKFLKVEFPVDVHSMNATYEIQFGHLQRPTHCNTSWDWAKYEVCGQKWVDLSEHEWGVALLTNCKYGYSTHGNVMYISLLRAPKAPDEEADMGSHEFSYAVYPHTGTFQSAGVIQQAYNFNQPISVTPGSVCQGFKERSFFHVDNPAVILETVKKAESISSAAVVRLYEAFGGHVRVRLTTSLPVKRAVKAGCWANRGSLAYSGNIYLVAIWVFHVPLSVADSRCVCVRFRSHAYRDRP
ncbi:Alpha-mannosidase 2C1 [Stylophora pistillata]|uniref:alpha-mannosidase n=1 Tax=Stylophora pistillata TaxID=50429 RepID=A0A2B4SXU4_STYPI|nr:Alpha-mannosidase 2C1 [Stylophora pistillata]